jgi:hypothetical protein
MKVAFELPPAQAEKLRQEAERLGVPATELARAAVSDLLAAPDDDFRAVATRVLRKNHELYRRLARRQLLLPVVLPHFRMLLDRLISFVPASG